MKHHTSYQLWTFQSEKVVKILQSGQTLCVDWKHTPSGKWRQAYRWMAQEMENRQLLLNGCAPVWAWHSCGEAERRPSLMDARMLLSDYEIEQGYQTIEFYCPKKYVLLSLYSKWNDIFYTFLEYEDPPEIKASSIEQLFNFSLDNCMNENESIQATLPFLNPEWIYDIRPLKLKPDNMNFDEYELV